MRIREFGSVSRLPGRAAGEDQGAGRHRHPVTDGLHVRADVLDRVVDREPGVQRSARRVHVDGHVLVGVLGLEVHELGDHQVRDLVVDRAPDEHDPLVQKARVDVEGALAP